MAIHVKHMSDGRVLISNRNAGKAVQFYFKDLEGMSLGTQDVVGFCKDCGAEVDGLDPDSEDCDCEDCGAAAVSSLLVLAGLI